MASITSVSPNRGAVAGGTPVTITGVGFFAPSDMTFGGVSATSQHLVSGTTLTCVTPAHVAGAVDVVVVNAGPDPLTLVNGYTYAAAPTVVSASPNTGFQFGGEDVTITGTGFLAVSGVTFGGAAATNVVTVDATTITCTAPAHAAGAVDVVVTNGDTQTGTGTGIYTYTTATPVAAGGGQMGIGMGIGVVPN